MTTATITTNQEAPTQTETRRSEPGSRTPVSCVAVDCFVCCLSAGEAVRLADQVARTAARTVVLRLTHVTDTCTVALAKLIALRARLLSQGRDLLLAGLGGRALARYEVARLERVLPLLGAAIDAGTPSLKGAA